MPQEILQNILAHQYVYTHTRTVLTLAFLSITSLTPIVNIVAREDIIANTRSKHLVVQTFPFLFIPTYIYMKFFCSMPTVY